MKKMILSGIFFLSAAGLASAQTTSQDRSSITNYASASSHEAKTSTHKKSTGKKKSVVETSNAKIETVRSSATAIPDNRKEYMVDGQLATYTGHQATPVNSDEYQSLKTKEE